MDTIFTCLHGLERLWCLILASLRRTKPNGDGFSWTEKPHCGITSTRWIHATFSLQWQKSLTLAPGTTFIKPYLTIALKIWIFSCCALNGKSGETLWIIGFLTCRILGVHPAALLHYSWQHNARLSELVCDQLHQSQMCCQLLDS